MAYRNECMTVAAAMQPLCVCAEAQWTCAVVTV